MDSFLTTSSAKQKAYGFLYNLLKVWIFLSLSWINFVFVTLPDDYSLRTVIPQYDWLLAGVAALTMVAALLELLKCVFNFTKRDRTVAIMLRLPEGRALLEAGDRAKQLGTRLDKAKEDSIMETANLHHLCLEMCHESHAEHLLPIQQHSKKLIDHLEERLNASIQHLVNDQHAYLAKIREMHGLPQHEEQAKKASA